MYKSHFATFLHYKIVAAMCVSYGLAMQQFQRARQDCLQIIVDTTDRDDSLSNV